MPPGLRLTKSWCSRPGYVPSCKLGAAPARSAMQPSSVSHRRSLQSARKQDVCCLRRRHTHTHIHAAGEPRICATRTGSASATTITSIVAVTSASSAAAHTHTHTHARGREYVPPARAPRPPTPSPASSDASSPPPPRRHPSTAVSSIVMTVRVIIARKIHRAHLGHTKWVLSKWVLSNIVHLTKIPRCMAPGFLIQ